MAKHEKRAKAALKGQTEMELQTVGVQLGNLEQYHEEFEVLKKGMSRLEQAKTNFQKEVERAKREKVILERPDAFELMGGDTVKFRFECTQDFIDLQREAFIAKCDSTVARCEEQLERIDDAIAVTLEKMNKRVQDIAEAKDILTRSEQFLKANGVEYDADAVKKAYQTDVKYQLK
jgi:ATP-dependent Lon protease